MDKKISRLTGLQPKELDLEFVKKQLLEIEHFLLEEKEGSSNSLPGKILKFSDLRPDLPEEGFREAGITFRVRGMGQRS